MSTDRIPKLMGAAEAAEALGTTTSNPRTIPHLPKPIQTLRCGSLWIARDINDLARKRGRKRGRK